MNETPCIRLARADDALGIQSIYAPFVKDTAISFETEIPSLQDMAHRIDTILRTHAWLVCEHHGQVIGYAYGGPHRARAAYNRATEVSVYVDANHYRKGVARGLYSALLNVLAKQGYCTALAGMTLPNELSVAFHRTMGFTPFARYEDIGYKFGKWHTTEWWRRPTGAPTSPPSLLQPVTALVNTEAWEEIIRHATQHLG